MVSSKRYMPTNKRFQDHTQRFVGTKTKKGNLNKGISKETGYLIRVEKDKIASDGWQVRLGKDKSSKEYNCTYGDNVIYLPECTETEKYYIPKEECQVEVLIDTKSEIYTVTRIIDINKKPIAMMDGQITLQGNGSSSIQVSGDTVKTSGKLESDTDITVSVDEKQISLVSLNNEVETMKKDGFVSSGDIVINLSDVQKKETTQSKSSSTPTISLYDLYQRVVALEKKVNGD